MVTSTKRAEIQAHVNPKLSGLNSVWCSWLMLVTGRPPFRSHLLLELEGQ